MKVFLKIFIFFLITTAFSQTEPQEFKNPILTGFHPDPSICRVGDDYYLVNSTFVWYPGIPIYHSKDLVNWKLIGHGIQRKEQLNFDGVIDKFGIFAPTIRYHNGMFYITSTCVECEGNFYITAKDPSGPWSDPVFLKDASGVDPSLFWDTDGKSYYIGTTRPETSEWLNQGEVWMQEIDLKKGKLFGERKVLTYGHANNASFPESPHIYKVNGKYVLLISEEGTEKNHAVTVHHSDSLWGPYVTDYVNPVMTHRHLGINYPVQAIGHADLVETQNGEWWSVVLGKRMIDGKFTLGRETFLAKVEFQDQTPIFNPEVGKVVLNQKRPDLPWSPVKENSTTDNFDKDELKADWSFIRTPQKEFYTLKNEKLCIKGLPETIDSLVNTSMLLKRIKDFNFLASTELNFKSKSPKEQAGLVIYRTNNTYYYFAKQKDKIVIIKKFKGEKEIVAEAPYAQKNVFLEVEGNGLEIQFKYGSSKEELKLLGEIQSLEVIADGNGNQFNGPGIGIYATGNGKQNSKPACYNSFTYKKLKK
ncbi:glycoside hydrolase family 43 protein [Mesonia aestuariivivens]|uniref:Glycoside hydrolase family 43 protein n=1 Tax=Mesonia aestuariivivens TaxID=2796128 RepID=A0ABS6W5G5_9FLAO|nr:glycoside hydrolase family 43 protein [Mesonia aestuariivivens]MBW2962726.1 glycoside hydrolase family 43 protein [Mesonia aestuariivivens]